MKIVLASINSKYIHSSLGVWYLHSAAKAADTAHTVEVYESTINNHIDDIVADIYNLAPDVVGFSCYIWNIEYVKKITECLKKINPQLKIFFGGPEAGFDAQHLFKICDVDYIIKGEGEQAFINLLKNDFTVAEKVIMAPVTEYFNPYSEEYFNALKGRIVYLETSRGCPFHCAFCLSGRDENVRFFDMDVSKQNILKLANCGTQTVKFVDRTFNCNDKRAREIFEFIYTQRTLGNIPENVVFHCEVEADLFTQETLDYLKTMPKGLFQFEAGLQSFNPQTLKAVDRRHNIERLVHNLKEIAQMKNIHLHIDLIAGLPYEDYTSFTEGFDLAFEIGAEVIQLGFLKLLNGSPLEAEKEKHGYKYWSYPPYQVICNNYIGYGDLLKLKLAEDAVERIYNSNRFPNTLKYVLNVTNMSPYSLFCGMGEYCDKIGMQSPSLDTYTAAMLEYLSLLNGVDKAQLRDEMAKDRIITDRTGKLYHCLHIADERMKYIRIALNNVDMDIFENQREKAKQGKIGFAVLYTNGQEQVILADYTHIDKVTAQYPHRIMPLEIFMPKTEE
ncbi:MAG: DUF4080 domain-containing protein [Oscillospiraceae bacterium]|nr:DUF4080 domain-containing protein [Oscillospiraceae bacterium]